MTKKHVELLARMLIGFYITMTFPVDIYPDWANVGLEIVGAIVIWGSFFELLMTNE